MTNYTKTTDFAAKDALPSGNSAKIVKGSEIDTEFNNIATASATKANKNDAALTGTTTFETISDGTIAITAFVDEDNMASNSATLLPTQQSVKAYVDSQVTAQDLDFQADSGGALSIDLDSETLTFTGGTGVDTSGSGNAVTFAIDSTVATLTGSQTLSNKTLATPVVSGNLTTDGLLDGRDVATDGTKLDGIEAGATADQTAAEIRTLVESATDSNVFTDADHSKLNGIEANATADQTAAEIRALVESATDSNVFTDADHSKLNGIEASADVTDTANVTAAGALMDSELTSEASVKALNQGVATTDSPSFAGLTTTANISFGDNDKAIFGAGSDLQIYHDGSNSYIGDYGQGDLKIRSNKIRMEAPDSQNMIIVTEDAGVSAYYNGTKRLEVTNTGIDVTGTVTADGLTVDTDTLHVDATNNRVGIGTSSPDRVFHVSRSSASVISGKFESASTSGSQIVFKDADTTTNDLQVRIGSDANDLVQYAGGSERLRIDSSGLVGIGTSSPTSKLAISGSSAFTVGNSGKAIQGIDITATAGGNNNFGGAISFGAGGTGRAAIATVQNSTDNDNIGLAFFTHTSTSTDDSIERLRIDSSGNVGIGVSNPSDYYASWNNLVVGDTSGSAGMSIVTGTSNEGTIAFADGTSGVAQYKGYIQYNQSVDRLVIGVNGAERMRILSGGNITIGTVDAYLYSNASSGGTTIDAGFKLESSNQALGFWTADTERMRIDSSGNLLVGKSAIGFSNVGFEARASGTAYITASGAQPLVLNRKSSDGDIVSFYKDGAAVGSIFNSGTTMGIGSLDTGVLLANNIDAILPWNASTNAERDNAIDLGRSAGRFDDIYATNGTIQTSDRNEKQDIEALSDAEQRVAVAAKGLLRKFRWKSSVEEKGDEARIHFGIIAQDLQDAFTAEGLDAGRYAMFINSTWTDEDTSEERTRLGVRYSELLAFIIAAI